MKLLITLLSCFTLLCASSAGAQQGQEAQEIRIATGADVGFTYLLVAAEKGFFEKYGITAEYRAFDDGAVALDALLTGESDLNMSSALGGISRRARGGDLYVVATAFITGVNVGLVAGEEISAPEDLVGKKVGYPAGTGGQEYFLRYVEHYGIDRSSLEEVQLSGPEAIAALRRGDIDALFIFEPWMERAVSEVPGMRVVARSGENDIYFQRGFTYFGQRLIEDQELGANVLRAIDEAMQWVKDNPDEAAELGAERYHVSVEDAKRQLARFDYGQRFTAEERAYMESAAQLLIDNGVIDAAPDMNEYLRPEILKSVFPDRVTE